MKLTDQQINSIISQLNTIAPNGFVCPVCGNQRWAINNIVTELREFENGNFIIGGSSAIVPHITLSCHTCAYTLFFNAIQLGIVSPNKNEQETKKNIQNGK